ncbi:MAG: 2Fe-2S iron-sulfur cluster-binding protein [Elusimicrobiota bacterium]|jgi:NADPH-dependent 2,4-dienoyl-CoA reductase/sulfur reductase-like enzyme/bacterioferritin-associated ferredoxin/NAD-dependent dihydropyrimidine dehydrogenase PreA subunit
MHVERITEHPVLQPPPRGTVSFTFDGRECTALEGEVLSSALFANGVKVFSRHEKDSSPQGIFCANGQCAQCSVIVDGLAVKSCVTPVRAGMKATTLRGAARLPRAACVQEFGRVEELDIDALIIGGGPSGLAAAVELGKLGVRTLVVDDKARFGGKLVLQTHKFFGSVEDCYAGTRGIDIAEKLEDQLKEYPSVTAWTNATCLAVFSDRKVGVLRGEEYVLVRPKAVISATGARERSLAFPGNTLPGVYGAGAFQTLVNRDLVRPAKRLFIVGGGNVGLIAAYHALQAGIQVVGLIEAQAECGGYRVHADKIKRLGVPVLTRHTVLRAEGDGQLERVAVAGVDEKFRPLPGTEKTFEADTLLIAVGLNPVDEFHLQAREAGMDSFVCGDAREIAEASAAMFSGKITAHEVLKSLGVMAAPVPPFWFDRLEVLKSRPGKTKAPSEERPDRPVYPVLHCHQEIPCNPCVTVCPKKSIQLSGSSIMDTPRFSGDCIGCFKCLIVCPGLAVTLVDRRKDAKAPTVAVPFEIGRGLVKRGDKVRVVGWEGADLGEAEVADVKDFKADNTLLVVVKPPPETADRVASLRLYTAEEGARSCAELKDADDATILCRCERVSLGEIRRAIRSGVRDLNQLKAVTRAGMGACGSKTCSALLMNVFRSEGVDPKEVTAFTRRPLFVEVPLGAFSNVKCRTQADENARWSGF